MSLNYYFNPNQIGTYHNTLSDLEKAISHHGDSLLIGAHKTLPKGHKGFLVEQVIDGDLDSLSHAQSAIIHSAMCYMGAIDYNEQDGVIFPIDPIDFDEPRFFRYCEDNVIRQLMLFKIESYENGVVNDHIFSYQKKFAAYGYLYHHKNQNTYEFVLRELHGFEGSYSLDAEHLALKIMKFRQLCKRAGIRYMTIEQNSHMSKLKPFFKLLQDNGAGILESGHKNIHGCNHMVTSRAEL